MKKVSNRKIIRILSLRTMKEKKWKNLIAILAIALTSLLFTALFTVGSSMVESIQEGTFRQVGNSAHGGYKYLSLEEYEKIKAAGGYKDISCDIVAGFGVNPELNAIQTEVRYGEDKMAKWSYAYPEEGQMPRERNQCAASSKVLEALGVPLRLGEKVPISIVTHDKNGNEKTLQEEFVLSGFWYSNDAAHAEEFWISREWLDENVDVLDQNYNAREKETGLYYPEGSIQAAVWLDSSYDIESQMKELTEKAGFTEDELRISVNWGYAVSSVDGVTIALGIGMLSIIMLSGYLIIYNIFYINVSTDIRYYGLLKTIGTTGRQLRRMVRIQALALSAAGIPLGLFLGWFVGKGIMPVVYVSFDMGEAQKIALNPWIFAFSALFSLLVVYISCIKPCQLATRVSPIEAVRYIENTGYKKKEKKSAKVSPVRLAGANMARNRRRAAVVIASLSLSMILLNGTYCMVKGFSLDKYVQGYLLSDIQVSHFSALNMSLSERDYEAVTPEAVAEIEALPGVEHVYTVKNRTGLVSLPKKMVEKLTAYYASPEAEESGMKGRSYMDEIIAGIAESAETNGSVYAIPEEFFSYLSIEEGNFDLEKFQQGGYALLLEDFNTKGWIEPGDRFTLGSYGDGDKPAKELEVMAVADFPSALSTRSVIAGGMRLLLCEKDMRELYDGEGSLHACIQVKEGMEKEAGEAIEALIDEKYPDLVTVTKESLKKEFEKDNQVFYVIGGLLSFILGVIGVLNLINAMITSILARRQEFAMMQAVGMTGRQLEQMLTMEGIWYGGLTLLISATLGNLVSYGLLYMLGRNMAYFEWGFHVLPTVASIPVMGLLSLVLPVICYHTLCKKSIIERLRLAEV